MKEIILALMVIVVFALLFLIVGLPLINEIMHAKIQLDLIAERAAQHRQQTTIILAGIIGFILLGVVGAYFYFSDKQDRRYYEHRRWELQARYVASLPPPSPPPPAPPTIVVINTSSDGRPNRGTALEAVSRQVSLAKRPNVIYQDEEGNWK